MSHGVGPRWEGCKHGSTGAATAATGTEAVTPESVATSAGGLEIGSGARRRPGVGTLAIIALFTASGSFSAASGSVTPFATGADSIMRSFRMSETPTVD